MVLFDYQVVNVQGCIEKGQVDVDSLCGVCQFLCGCGLILVQVSVVCNVGSGWVVWWLFVSELVWVICQLVSLLVVSLLLEGVLSVVIEQVECLYVVQVFIVVCVDVFVGQCLIVVLVVWLCDFLLIYCVLVGVGEDFGDLVWVMECLVDYIEECNVLQVKVLIVFIYLVVISLVLVVIVIFLFSYVVLQVVIVFVQVWQMLLMLIQVMLVVSVFVCSWGMWVGFGIVVLVVVWWLVLCKFGLCLCWDVMLLWVLMVGCFVLGVNSVCFVLILVILLDVGVLLLCVFEVVWQILGNVLLVCCVYDVFVCVCEGVVFGFVLKVQKVYLLILVYLVVSGEKIGLLVLLLDCVVQIILCEIECCVMVLIVLLELIMILVMGGVVLMIVLVVLMLIMEMNQLVQ